MEAKKHKACIVLEKLRGIKRKNCKNP